MFEGVCGWRTLSWKLPERRQPLFAMGQYDGPPGQPPVQRQNRQQYASRVPQAPGNKSGIVRTVLGLVAALFTVLEFISSFLPWLVTGGVSNTGINLMTSAGPGGRGFFMIRWGWGGILFTGFWSLLFGALMLIPVIFLLLNKRSGASWAIALGVLAFFITLVNIIMIYSTLEGSSVGAGLWVLLASAIVMLICGIVVIRVST